MKNLLIFILILSFFKSIGQTQDESNIRMTMGIQTCFEIKQNGDGCLEVRGAPSIYCFDLFYRSCNDSEFIKFTGDNSNFNSFIKNLCKNDQYGCKMEVIVQEKIDGMENFVPIKQPASLPSTYVYPN